MGVSISWAARIGFFPRQNDTADSPVVSTLYERDTATGSHGAGDDDVRVYSYGYYRPRRPDRRRPTYRPNVRRRSHQRGPSRGAHRRDLGTRALCGPLDARLVSKGGGGLLRPGRSHGKRPPPPVRSPARPPVRAVRRRRYVPASFSRLHDRAAEYDVRKNISRRRRHGARTPPRGEAIIFGTVRGVCCNVIIIIQTRNGVGPLALARRTLHVRRCLRARTCARVHYVRVCVSARVGCVCVRARERSCDATCVVDVWVVLERVSGVGSVAWRRRRRRR